MSSLPSYTHQVEMEPKVDRVLIALWQAVYRKTKHPQPWKVVWNRFGDPVNRKRLRRELEVIEEFAEEYVADDSGAVYPVSYYDYLLDENGDRAPI